jgi:hypothetical protein
VGARTWKTYVLTAGGVLAAISGAHAQQCDDPVETKLVATPADVGDTVGLRVGISGDYAVLGSQGNSPAGAAFVFFRDNGVWSQQARLQGPGSIPDQFGNQVAIDGDTIAVGAPRFDNQDNGLVRVYERDGTSWGLQETLTAPFFSSGQRFGSSLAIDGDTLVVGAAFGSATGSRSGAAYVFVRSDGVWQFQQRLTPDSGTNLFFGVEVAVDGDTVLVGSTGDNDAATQAGAVYVFTRNGSNWSRQQKLLPPGLTVSSNLGRVAIQGDTAVISSADVFVNRRRGAAFVYTRSGGAWTPQQTLTASDGRTGQSFGNLVDIDGDRILVGAQHHNGDERDAGAGYVFARQNGRWVQQLRLTASDANEGANLGIGIGLSGDTALLGAFRATLVPGGDMVGAGYVYDLPDASCPPVRVFPRTDKGFLHVKKATARVRDGLATVSVVGQMDLGPDGPDLGRFPSMDIGSSFIELPEDVEPDRRGRIRIRQDGARVDFIPSKRGSSLGTVKIKVTGAEFDDPEGVLRVRLGGGGIDGEAELGLRSGKYRAGRNALVSPLLAVTKFKAKVAREGDHRFSLLAQIPTEATGDTPEDPPELFVQLGDLEFEVPAEELVRNENKGTWEYRAPRGTDGVTQLRVDYRRGLVLVNGDDVTLGDFEVGPVPLTLFIGIDDELVGIEVLVVRKGNGLRY